MHKVVGEGKKSHILSFKQVDRFRYHKASITIKLMPWLPCSFMSVNDVNCSFSSSMQKQIKILIGQGRCMWKTIWISWQHVFTIWKWNPCSWIHCGQCFPHHLSLLGVSVSACLRPMYSPCTSYLCWSLITVAFQEFPFSQACYLLWLTIRLLVWTVTIIRTPTFTTRSPSASSISSCFTWAKLSFLQYMNRYMDWKEQIWYCSHFGDGEHF